MTGPHEQPISKKPWFRFTLRSLLVMVLAAAVALSWLAIQLQQSKQQDLAIEEIIRSGGHVSYAYEWQGGHFRFSNATKNPKPIPRTPNWMSRIAGTALLDHPIVVQFKPGAWKDDALTHVSALHDLEAAFLYGGEASDQAFQQLTELDDLETLELVVPSKMSDDGLKVLPEMASLSKLRIQGTQFTDESLKYVGGVRTLKRLTLTWMSISDDGLRHLHDLYGLEELRVQKCSHVTPEGMDALRLALPGCEVILQP